MNETRRKPTTGRQSPSLFDKWHGIFYMPSRIDEAGHTKAFEGLSIQFNQSINQSIINQSFNCDLFWRKKKCFPREQSDSFSTKLDLESMPLQVPDGWQFIQLSSRVMTTMQPAPYNRAATEIKLHNSLTFL